jgi:uncharacterized protein (TIGR02594 family)
MDQPRWLAFAWADLGVAGTPGPANTQRVLRYYADAGHPEIADDDVAWCAAFTGACLERAGVPGTRSLLARSYLDWGEPLDDARTGAIAVLSRGGDPSLGHVGFLIGETPSAVILLGGNQGNAVTVSAFPRSRLLGLRWPGSVAAVPTPSVPPRSAAQEDALFERALTHVLGMEGGYAEDPYDPGGPTNFGITLGEHVRDKGVTLTAANLAELKAELRAIPRAAVRRIYRQNYWQAAVCPALPPALAVFHFDAAVNQGVFGSARFLQQAVGADVDGEIGPLTLSAVASSTVPEVLARYAEVRRQHYRSLSTFWRFGRGWLARVDSALQLANSVLRDTPAQAPSQPVSQKEPRPMPDPTESTTPATPAETPSEGKWWGHSMTIWGTILTLLTTVLPVIGPVFGLNLTAELVRQLGDNLVQCVQAAGGLIGTLMAIWGRARAAGPIERRQFLVRM